MEVQILHSTLNCIEKGIYRPTDIAIELGVSLKRLQDYIISILGREVSLTELVSRLMCIPCANDRCNNIVKFQTGIFRKYCSLTCRSTVVANTKEHKDKASITLSTSWKNPIHRATFTNASRLNMTALWMDRDWRSNRSIVSSQTLSLTMKRIWSNDKERDMLIKSMYNTTIVHGLNCQGYESNFINYLYDNNYPLPVKPKPVITPSGYYLPDFEYDKFYVEIKSTWTIEKSIESGQMDKINWTSDNMKPVIVLNLSLNITYNIIDDLFYNLNN